MTTRLYLVTPAGGADAWLEPLRGRLPGIDVAAITLDTQGHWSNPPTAPVPAPAPAAPAAQGLTEASPGTGERPRRIWLLPCLCDPTGPWATETAPRAAEALRVDLAAQGQEVEVELLPALAAHPLQEEALVDIVDHRLAAEKDLPTTGAAIEATSHAIIDRRLAREGLEARAHAVLRRIIHASADFTYLQTLRIHPEAIDRAVAALRAGAPIFCDVRMLARGITRAPADCERICAIDDPEVHAAARTEGITRATAAMRQAGDRLEGAIVAVGNAPTALWELMRLARAGGPRPAVVVGLPVGFVGARESKLALIDSGLVYIANTSPRGGSPVAAACVNALALLAETEPAGGAPPPSEASRPDPRGP